MINKWQLMMTVFSCVLLFSLASCGNSADSKTSYVETSITLPENSEGIMDMKILDDGTILVASAYNGSRTGALWKSADGGNSWDRIVDYTDVLGVDPDNSHVECIPNIADNGDILCMVSTITDWNTFEGYIECFIVTAEGNKEAVTVDFPETGMSEAAYTGNEISIRGDILDSGDLLLANESGEMYIVNRDTFQITGRVFNEGNALYGFDGYSVDGNILYAIGLKDNIRYDLKNRKIVNSKEVSLKKAAEEYKYNGTTSIMTTKNGIHYTVSDDGIKMYDNGTADIIVPDKDMSIVPSDVYLETIEADKSGNIYLALNREGKDAMLLMYSPTNGSQKNVKGDLEIYTLKNDDDIEKIVSYYKKEKKDVNITLTVGIDNGEIEDDAIKKLNTKLLSGDGPDVIIFDGMDVDNYVDSKLLRPIEGINKKLYIGGVVDAFSSEGNIYAVPARAILPVCLGNRQFCEAETGREFTDAITENGVKVEAYSIVDIIGYYYQVYLSDNLILENGEVNAEAIREYLHDINKIYKKYSEGEKVHLSHITMSPKDTAGMLNVLTENDSVDVDYIYEVNQIQMLQLFDRLSYIMASQNNKVCYIPRIITGISVASKNIKEAEDFIDFIMSEEGQSISGDNMGLPVNKEVVWTNLEGLQEETMIVGNEQESKTVTLKPLTGDSISEFTKTIEDLKTPLKNDATALGIVMEYSEKYINGEMDIDKAVENISKKLSLHVSE